MASFASSYIKTSTVAVTRNADILTYPSAGNISGTGGSVFASVTSYAVGAQVDIIDAYDGGAGLGIPLLIQSGGSLGLLDNNFPKIFAAVALSSTTPKTIATKWGAAACSGFAAGAQVGASQVFSGNLVLATAFAVGIRASGIVPMFGTIRNVRIYPHALSDAKLIAMTT